MHGNNLEFFRKESVQPMLKKIACPICSRRLFDTDETELVDMRPADQSASKPGLFYVKCSKCSSTWAAMLRGRAEKNTFNYKQQGKVSVPTFSIPIEGLTTGKVNIQISYSVQSWRGLTTWSTKMTDTPDEWFLFVRCVPFYFPKYQNRILSLSCNRARISHTEQIVNRLLDHGLYEVPVYLPCPYRSCMQCLTRRFPCRRNRAGGIAKCFLFIALQLHL